MMLCHNYYLLTNKKVQVRLRRNQKRNLNRTMWQKYSRYRNKNVLHKECGNAKGSTELTPIGLMDLRD